MAKWSNQFISGKEFQKRLNLADLALKKVKWQPCMELFKLKKTYKGSVLSNFAEP
jgi:hypothetical protein